MTKLIRIALVIACASLFTSSVFCQVQRVPFTNRFQLLLLEESDLVNQSEKQYRQFLNDNKPVSSSDKHAARVKRIGNELLQSTRELLEDINKSDRIEDFEFEFNLVNKNEVNAWCMPGGKIVVYSGILPFCNNDPLMAALIAHEIAHAVAWHANERISQRISIQGLGSIFSNRFEDFFGSHKELFNIVYDVTSGVGLLAYSREHEYEADLIGMYIMANAGYDPAYAVQFWENMMKANKGRGFQFLSTHPTSENRIKSLREMLPEAKKYYKND